jgi:two-component system, NarL family, nitrate/nitrite response regulator NarL
MHNHYVPTIIVDRNALFRVGLIHTLSESRFRVTAEYSAFNELLVDEAAPKAGLLLIGLDDLINQSLEEFRQFKKSHGDFHVALLGEHADEKEVRIAIDFCGECYVIKNAINPAILLQSLELVMTGQSVFTHEFMRVLQSEWSSRESAAPPPPPPSASPLDTAWEIQRVLLPIGDAPAACRLSEREAAILMRLMHGASNKVIARELDIAEATVKVHVKSVLRKVRVKNRTQAATWAWSRCAQRGVSAEQSDGPALDDIIVTGPGSSRNGPSENGVRTEPAQPAGAASLTYSFADN